MDDQGIERVSRIPAPEFANRYIAPGRPVIVTDAMESWPALGRWTPSDLRRRYGMRTVPLYGKYFDFLGTTTLGDYVERYMDGRQIGVTPYVRWFTKHQKLDPGLAATFPWADEVLDALRGEWVHPYFLPTTSYLFPYCCAENLDVPSASAVPSKALYLSGTGAATNLHIDFWGSDAVLCQLFGEKEVILYEPEQAKYLVKEQPGAMRGTSGGRRFVDIRNPDLQTFPDFGRAGPPLRGRLLAGEIAYIPAGWLHHVDTLSSSIMLTWNFVHAAGARRWFRYLAGNPPSNEVEDIEYILFEAPGRLS